MLIRVSAVAYQPMTLGDLAIHLSATTDHERRWRLVSEFLEEFSHEDRSSGELPPNSPAVDDVAAGSPANVAKHRVRLLAAEPPSCGDARWDTLVAAIAEHLSWADAMVAPAWCTKPNLMWFGKVWFVDPLPSAQAWALAHSPASFRRRGIFLHPDDLGRA
jgi:hypothetical protein